MKKIGSTLVVAVTAASALALTAAPSVAQERHHVRAGTRYHSYHQGGYYRGGGLSFGFGFTPGYYGYGYPAYGYDYDDGYYPSNCWVWSPYWGRYVRTRWCD